MKEKIRHCFVYVISSTCETYHKVGISFDVTKRMDDISSLSPLEFKKSYSFKTPAKCVALLLESNAHKELKSNGMHHKLEWFVGSKKDVVDIVKSVCTKKSYAEYKEQLKIYTEAIKISSWHMPVFNINMTLAIRNAEEIGNYRIVKFMKNPDKYGRMVELKKCDLKKIDHIFSISYRSFPKFPYKRRSHT